MPELEPGMELIEIAGIATKNLEFQQCIHLMQKAGRPLTLTFVPGKRES